MFSPASIATALNRWASAVIHRSIAPTTGERNVRSTSSHSSSPSERIRSPNSDLVSLERAAALSTRLCSRSLTRNDRTRLGMPTVYTHSLPQSTFAA